MSTRFAWLNIRSTDSLMPRSLLFAVILALALMPFAFDGTLAAPGTPVPSSGTPTSTSRKHCVTLLEQDTSPQSAEAQRQIAALAAASGKPVSVERPGAHVCFAMMTQVQQYLKAHGITDGSEAGQVSAQTIGDGGSGYSIASLYDGAQYSGDSELFVSSTTCFTNAHYYNYVGGWINDRTSSSTASSGLGCAHTRFYLDADFGNGPYSCTFPDSAYHCAYVGDGINDATSSLAVY